MKDMLSHINSTAKSIWRKMRNKEYRDSFVAANVSNTISAQIHTMRESRKWTQTELASRCDMRQPRISALEDPDCENVEIATLRRVASAFDVALLVRFAPFSEVALLSSSLKPSDFNVPDYSSDYLKEAKVVRNATVHSQGYIMVEINSTPKLNWNTEVTAEPGALLDLAFIHRVPGVITLSTSVH